MRSKRKAYEPRRSRAAAVQRPSQERGHLPSTLGNNAASRFLTLNFQLLTASQPLDGSVADGVDRLAGGGDNAAHGEETVDQLRVIQRGDIHP